MLGGVQDQSGSKRGNKRRANNAQAPKQNTAIYVTGLPLDVTADEVAELFSRKCGVIAEEIDSGRPRIKLYTDAKGHFKGDALIDFFKPQSVDMAIMLLDDTTFHFSKSDLGSGRMRVQEADSSYKKTNYGDEAGAGGSGNGDKSDKKAETSGGGGGGGGDKNRRNNDADKQKIIKKTQTLDAKLADWSDDESYPATAEAGGGGKSSKWDKVVILRHMFTLEELEEDPAALLDIKEDVRDECAKLGEVTNVVLFDLEPSGLVSVKFRKPESAQACVRLMDGRAFAGRTVEAAIATGREKYSKSKKKDDNDDDGDDEEKDE